MQGAIADTPSSLTKTPMGYTFRRSRWDRVGLRLMLGALPHSTPTAPRVPRTPPLTPMGHTLLHIGDDVAPHKTVKMRECALT